MANPFEKSNSEESKTTKGLSYTEALEIVRTSFARHGIDLKIATPAPQPKELVIDVTFIQRKKFPKP